MMRIRTIQFFEGKIIDALSQQHRNESNLLFKDLRGAEEEDSFDIAVEYLISKGIVKRYKRKGLTSYELAA